VRVGTGISRKTGPSDHPIWRGRASRSGWFAQRKGSAHRLPGEIPFGLRANPSDETGLHDYVEQADVIRARSRLCVLQQTRLRAQAVAFWRKCDRDIGPTRESDVVAGCANERNAPLNTTGATNCELSRRRSRLGGEKRRAYYAAVVRLAVGDMVVYGSHGAGHVAARERRVVLGKRQEVIVLALAGGLSVELPMERAHQLLRPLASEADMSRVQKTLGADHAISGDPWLKRRRDSQAKLTGGDAIELAEVIRDSARREWTLPAKGTKSQLSPGERALFVKARELLSNEIALVRGVEPAEANAWIDEQLTRTG
jgi:RNA polymerase-interacting CarD/CdnL/TRCF family regulator